MICYVVLIIFDKPLFSILIIKYLSLSALKLLSKGQVNNLQSTLDSYSAIVGSNYYNRKSQIFKV